MRDFYKTFLDEMEHEYNANPTQFSERFNNNPNQKQAKNRAPRTDLMLGCGNSRQSSLIWRAVKARFCSEFPHWVWAHPSFERYSDLQIWAGDFQRGERFTEFVCEVENTSNEDNVRGTMVHLLRVHSRRRAAVVYIDYTPNLAQKIEHDVLHVFQHFLSRGFREAGDTENVVIVGPTRIQNFDRRQWRALYFLSPTPQASVAFSWLP